MNKTITIFEGVDGSGKTTAAKRLAELTGAEYVHCGLDKEGTSNLTSYYIDRLMPALLGQVDIVMDRSWISEKVYGPIMRGGMELSPKDFDILELLVSNFNVTVIITDPEWNRVMENYLERQAAEYVQNTDKLEAIYNTYKHKQKLTSIVDVVVVDLLKVGNDFYRMLIKHNDVKRY